MIRETYITSSCTIGKGIVYKNDTILFEHREIDDPAFLVTAYRHFGFKYPKFFKMDNLARLGWLAAEVLLQNRVLTDNYSATDIGIVFSNANSSLDADKRYFDSTREIASPALFVYTLPNIVIGEISIRHQLKGENAFFIFDNFNASFIQQYVSNLINSNILQACICGWVELLGNEYKTVMFLVEKNGSTAFTEENINKIYQLENG